MNIRKFFFIMRHWKLGVHLLFRTSRFGVNNQWWSTYPSLWVGGWSCTILKVLGFLGLLFFICGVSFGFFSNLFVFLIGLLFIFFEFFLLYKIRRNWLFVKVRMSPGVGLISKDCYEEVFGSYF